MCGRKLQKNRVGNAEFIHIVDTILSGLDKDDFEAMAVVARNL